MYDGVPPGGALVPELLALANRAVGNRWDAPAIELFAGMSIVARGGPVEVCVDGRCHELAEGDALQIPHPQPARVAYLAVAGGVDVPPVLGGRGLLLVAGLGGGVGRALRRGDRLPVSMTPLTPRLAPSSWLDLTARIRVIPGPDRGAFSTDALDALTASTWRVSLQSDRTGIRLDGPRLERASEDAGVSMPMVRGAIEVPSGGQPIVLGPDHPTTGGYPVLATVARADLGQFAARRPGAEVRFVLVSVGEAREAWREWVARLSG